MRKQPYLLWTRDDFWLHLQKQAAAYGMSETEQFEIKQMVYDMRWHPRTDYDGCTFIQDAMHPFVPCFIHDYRCIVQGWANKWDVEFYHNNVRFGLTRLWSGTQYLVIRCAYYLYYKWK
jgi:hypothetical protein